MCRKQGQAQMCSSRNINDAPTTAVMASNGEGNDLHAMKWILYDTCQIGWSGFFFTYSASSAISSWNEWIDFDWIYLVGFNSFCLAFFGLMTLIFSRCWDRDSSKLRNFLDVKNETHWDREIPWMSRPSHRDWEICWMGETETSSDWTKNVDTKTPSRLSPYPIDWLHDTWATP